MFYETPHILRGPYGNNAFSYELRDSPSLYIPSVIEGNFSDVRLGNEIVFEDRDDTGVLRSCAWLEHFVRTTFEGVPVIVFDNHNHALYFWYEALARGIVSRGSTLVHIDEHSDLWENSSVIPVKTGISSKLSRRNFHEIPASAGMTGKNAGMTGDNRRQNGEWFKNTPLTRGGESAAADEGGLISGIIDLEQVFHFTNYSCNVGNYIQPALREGIIGKMIRIEWGVDMERHGSYVASPDESLILNLDLDFFAPELDYISFESKKACILHFARQARLITIATSPFFIDQGRAIEMMRRVFDS